MVTGTIHPKSENSLRVVLVGDVVGKPGMKVACEAAPWLQHRLGADVCLVNAENAADGTGLRIHEYKRLIEAGYHGVTLGDHIYKKREIIDVLETESNILKPANFPPRAPGKTSYLLETPLGSLAVISVMGRVFMRPVDCPLHALDRVLGELPSTCKMILVEVHAEATSDKQVIGRYLDGRVSAVLGTHTHVTTADDQILPKGTAFQCDIGMTGPFESIIGRQIEPVIATTLTFDPNNFHVATEDVRLSATWVDIDAATGKALAIGRIQWKDSLLQEWNKELADLRHRM